MTGRKLRIAAGLALVTLTVGLCVSLSSTGKASDLPEPEPEPVCLNEILSNELSDTSSLSGLDARIASYMRQWCLRGASLAIMRGDSLLYAKGYGWADEEAGVKMAPTNIMRVASVSKLLTATGIMMLQERGKLTLADTVFGRAAF